MEVHHSYLVELSLGNHSVAVLGLAVGLVAAGLGEHTSVKYRMNVVVGSEVCHSRCVFKL